MSARALALGLITVAILAIQAEAFAGDATPRPAAGPTPRPAARPGPQPPAQSPVENENSPWRDRAGAYHGDLSGLAWGGQGELRFAEDRVHGVTDPEWFSVGRVGGFLSVRLNSKIEFLGEGAWDQGPEDFSMEQLNVRALIRRDLNLHAGVFLVPLGRTNLTHDAPLYEFAERSLPATQLIGVPNAQLGAGVRGEIASIAGWPLSWEADVVTGYDDGLIMDAAGGTRVPQGRNNYGDNNGVPAFVGRLSLHPAGGSEIGFAAESGRYNQTVLAGVQVDIPRYVHVLVVDATGSLAGFGLFSEAAMAIVDVPPGLGTIFAERQWGASVEVTRPLLEPMMKSWSRTRLTGALRVDAVDFDRAIPGDSRSRLSTSLNFHRLPIGGVRLGWYYELARDRFNSETPKAGVTLTTAAYF